MSSFGGFIVTAFLCWPLFPQREQPRKEGKPAAQRSWQTTLASSDSHYGDCVIYGFPMAFGFGRIGCFMAHDHRLESDFFLAVQGLSQSLDGCQLRLPRPRIPEAIWACSMIGVVYFLDKKAFPSDFTWR